MCCLLYEDELYTQARADFPRIGETLHTLEGDYKVTSFNILSRSIKLEGNDEVKFIPLEDYRTMAKGGKAMSFSDLHKSEPAPASSYSAPDMNPSTKNQKQDNAPKDNSNNNRRNDNRNRGQRNNNRPQGQNNNNRQNNKDNRHQGQNNDRRNPQRGFRPRHRDNRSDNKVNPTPSDKHDA